ncbi:MAG: BamA/TamA family outer membrane protein [Candidatus Thiodiazotropha sp. (ex Ctena orbiculata)]|nr:BamA/TamA family outer membrane protein [Candidatus Thiodiazotropha taylori]
MSQRQRDGFQCALVFCLLGVVCMPIYAAEPSFDLEPQFGGGAESSSDPGASQVLPPLKLPESSQKSVIKKPLLRLKTVVLRGNTVLTEEEVKAVVAPYIQKDLNTEELQSLRQKLTMLYVNRGYINSGVVIPEQAPVDGVLLLQVVEGKLVEVFLEQESTLDENYVARQIAKEVSAPLSLGDIEAGIRRLEINPLIRRVDGRLLPADKIGEARLGLKVEENNPFSVTTSLDNHESPSVGAERGSLILEHLNLSGHRDELRFSLAATEGLRKAFASYRLPFWEDLMSFGIHYERGTSEVVERPFDDLEIEGDTENAALSLGYHFIDTLDRKVSLLSGIEYAYSETELLDQPYSFSSGAQQGETVSASVRLGVEWVERWDSQLLALRATVRRGVDWLGSTMIEEGAATRELDTGAEIPDSRFTIFLTQAQWANRLTLLDSQVLVNLAWQQSRDPLLSVDKFAIGGKHTVRGFRENALLRDSGAYANLEWRVPLLRDNPEWSGWELTAIPFFDYGRSWDRDDNLTTHSAATLTSIGIGLTARPMDDLYMELFYGKQLKDDDYQAGQEHDLQDEGIHFSVSYRWSPNT